MEAIAQHQSESDLVDLFVAVLAGPNSPWGKMRLSREFYYMNGRTDVIAIDREGLIIAFEGKLEKWKQALGQAYRNLCFAHRSYVLVPKRVALRAYQFEAEFRKRGVGLCYMENSTPVVLLEADLADPIQPWLSKIALLALNEDNDGQL